jgi:hypothetical protein
VLKVQSTSGESVQAHALERADRVGAGVAVLVRIAARTRFRVAVAAGVGIAIGVAIGIAVAVGVRIGRAVVIVVVAGALDRGVGTAEGHGREQHHEQRRSCG